MTCFWPVSVMKLSCWLVADVAGKQTEDARNSCQKGIDAYGVSIIFCLFSRPTTLLLYLISVLITVLTLQWSYVFVLSWFGYKKPRFNNFQNFIFGDSVTLSYSGKLADLTKSKSSRSINQWKIFLVIVVYNSVMIAFRTCSFLIFVCHWQCFWHVLSTLWWC